jgi:hypothetical protein
MRLWVRYILISIAVVVLLGNLIVYLYGSSNSKNDLDKLLRKSSDLRLDELPWPVPLHQHFPNGTGSHHAQLDLMPQNLRFLASGLPVKITAEEFRSDPEIKTGNPLIDTYGQNDDLLSGEKGRGITFVDKEKLTADKLMAEFNVNVRASDLIPLNRMVPDSRLAG